MAGSILMPTYRRCEKKATKVVFNGLIITIVNDMINHKLLPKTLYMYRNDLQFVYIKDSIIQPKCTATLDNNLNRKKSQRR